MSTITKERVAEIIHASGLEPCDYEAVFDSIKTGEIVAIARIALASLESEPAGYHVIKECGAVGCSVATLKEAEETRDFWNKNWTIKPYFYTAPPAPVSVPDDVSGPLAHAYKELTPTFMRNHIDVFERYGIYPDGSAGIQAMRIALDGMSRRAAMLLGSEPDFRENAETSTKCWCHTCRPVKISDMRFVVCPDCGNKRCPHANDHRNACTGSNEPGQEGSAYPAAPQQEVTQALAKGMERYGDAMQELAQREVKP